LIVFSSILLLSYFILIIWLTDGLRKNSNEEKIEATSNLPFVTVIVSARNEQDNIDNLCTCLQDQKFPTDNLEIIIVNDRSTDNTPALLKKWENQISNLNVITVKDTPVGWAPKKWALNQAISASKNEILIQTDADCIFSENWLRAMVQPFADSNTGFVSGPAPLIHSNKLINSMFEMESLSMDAFFGGAIKRRIPISCTGRNMGFRKDAFNQVGGYQDISDQISGDDDLLLQKFALSSNWDIEFVNNPDSVVKSLAPDSLESFISQRMRFASKGFKYYNLPTTSQIKLILPYIFFCNLLVMICTIKFTIQAEFVWLLPLIMKILSDGWITIVFYSNINKRWTFKEFAIMSILHPFYVVIFALIAPFTQINWKNE